MIQLNFMFTFTPTYALLLILEKLIQQLMIRLLVSEHDDSIQFIIDEDSYQLYLSITLSRFNLVHSDGAIIFVCVCARLLARAFACVFYMSGKN